MRCGNCGEPVEAKDEWVVKRRLFDRLGSPMRKYVGGLCESCAEALARAHNIAFYHYVFTAHAAKAKS